MAPRRAFLRVQQRTVRSVCGVGDMSADPGAGVGRGWGCGPVEPHVQGLSPGTVYHYRLVVQSAVRGEPFVSDGFSFLTQQSLSGPLLADGRAWELVSPPDKRGGALVGIDENSVAQAAANGGRSAMSRAPRLKKAPRGFMKSSRCSPCALRAAGPRGCLAAAFEPGGDGSRRRGMSTGSSAKIFARAGEAVRAVHLA